MITIRGVGPTRDTFPFNTGHSAVGRMTALTLGANGSRMYAGSFAGVWRSDDAGRNWHQLTWPQPSFGSVQADIPGALYAPHIFDLVSSPANANLVLASALDSQYTDGRDGIYRTIDGGASWTLVHKTPLQCNIVFAPDDSELVYAAMGSAVGVSRDAGATWSLRAVNPAWHVAVGPLEANGRRRVYAVGDSRIWYSSDGGNTWAMDNGASTIMAARQVINAKRKMCFGTGDMGIGGFGGAITIQFAGGTAGRTLAVQPDNPERVFMATEGAANGPSFYGPVADGTLCNTDCDRMAGEGSLWVGDFSQFGYGNPQAQWTQLPGPPVYFGTTSPSGVVFVEAKRTSSGFLVFFADSSHVHISAGTPTAASSWHRLDGEDASVAKRAGRHKNVVFVHPDPHAIAFTRDFEITLKPPGGVSAPFNNNSELDQHIGGTLWMANDGGINWTEDGGRNANSWKWPLGLETLDAINICGLFGLGGKPALYFGAGDNNDFFSRDGGETWQDPGSNCGDCDAWFADTAQAGRVIQFLPRRQPSDTAPKGYIGVIVSSDASKYPDAQNGPKIFPPSTRAISTNPTKHLVAYASSGLVLRGYRPVIKTLATEAAPADGDYVFIDQALDTGVSTLLRTTAISSITQLSDWADPAKATPIGPMLPTGVDIAQVSGGHVNPVYFVGDAGGKVYKLNPAKTQWNKIVPNTAVVGTGVNAALRWFVDPYEPHTIYVLDSDGVKVSVDGAESWFFDGGMTNALTLGGKLTISGSLLQDMQFSRGERQTRFAMGTAGVFCTMDFGVYWFPVLNSIALPGRPESGFFDPLSDQSDRAIYVECEGRSILRVGGLPELSPFQPPVPFDLMEFAALEY